MAGIFIYDTNFIYLSFAKTSLKKKSRDEYCEGFMLENAKATYIAFLKFFNGIFLFLIRSQSIRTNQSKSLFLDILQSQTSQEEKSTKKGWN